MAVFSYVGGSVSITTGGYGNLAVRKGAQVAQPNTITVSARSFTEGTPASGLFDGVDRSFLYSRIAFTPGFSANKLNFNTTEPYNSGAYSTSAYINPSDIIFDGNIINGVTSAASYNTETNSGAYWAHAYGYTNTEFGTAITVDKSRNAWVVGNTDFNGATITSITASLTPTASFTNSTTTPTSGTNDSGYFAPWTLPFQHNIFRMGETTSNIAVMTNSWISFAGAVNTTQTTFSATSPNYPNLQINAGETSCQIVYWGTFGTAPTRTFRIRFEGTDATTGIQGDPRIIWEFILYESNPNIFDIQTGGTLNTPSPRFSGISNGNSYFGTFNPATNSGYRFTTTGVHQGAAGNNITLVKYDTKGQFQRQKDFPAYTGTEDLAVLSIGRNGSDVGEAVKVGSDGRLYILFTSSSLGYVSGVANNDFGIIKIDPKYYFKESSSISAATVWAKTFGTTSRDDGQSLDIDSNDNLYVSGFTAGSGQGSNDVFVLKIDKNANILWKRTYGSTSGDIGNAIKASLDGSVYVWGISTSTPLVGTADYFLLKINGSTGALVWQKHFNISATTNAQVFENTVEVDPFGNVYVNGYSSVNPNGYFVAKLDSNGNFVWSRNVGAVTANPDAGTSIKYKNGFIYVGGQDSSTTNNGEGVGLGVTKIDANSGRIISNYVIGGVSSEYAYAIDIDDYNDIYATGAVNTTMTGLTSATGANALVTKFILDTPLGGFTLSGDARIWSSTTAKRYTTSRQAFTAEDIVFENDLIATGQQFIFVGTISETQVNFEKEFRFSGSGSLFITDNNVDTGTTFDSPVTTPSIQLFTIGSGYTSVKATNAFLCNVETNLINTSGSAITRAPNKHIGASPIEYYNPSQVVFGDEENFRASEFKTEATAFYRFQKGAFSASGSISSGDTAFQSTTNVAFIPLNTILIYNTNAFTKLAMQYAGKSPTTPFGGLEIVFEEIEANAPPQQFKYSGAVSEPIRTFRWVATPSNINITGTAVEKSTEAYADSGSITTGFTAGAKVSFRPFDATDSDVLCVITGQHGTRVFVPNWSASGSIQITGGTTPTPAVNSWVGSSPIEYFNAGQIVFEDGEIFGASQFKYTSTSFYRFQKGTFSGTGVITADPNASAAVVFNPPDTQADIQLFSVTGAYSDLRFTSNNLITQAPLFTGAEGSARVTFNPPEFDPLFAITGSLVERYTKGLYTGDGSINSSNFGSARVAFRPFDATDSDPLFSINGQHGTRVFVPNWPASGTILITGEATQPPKSYNWIGASPIEYYNPGQIVFEDGENFRASEFKYDSTSLYRFQNANFNASGSITVDPNASAAVVFNPPDTAAGIQLFSVTGAYSDLKFIKKSSEASGTIAISGAASDEKQIDVATGSGSTSITGTLVEKQTDITSGSGTLFSASGAAESIGVNPVDTTQLFDISGTYSNLRSIFDPAPFSGTITISGASVEPTKQFNWIGSSPTAYYNPYSIVFGEDENGIPTEYRNISTAKYRNEFVESGSGSLLVDGSAGEIYKAGPFATSGGITISGASTNIQFISQAGEAPILFQISGAAAQPSVQYAWIGASPNEYFNPDDIVFGEGENFRASEFKYDSTALYRFQNSNFNASGSITVDPNASAAVVFNPPDTQADIQLFSVTGAYSDLKFTSRNTGSGSVTFSGSAVESQTDSISVSGSIVFSGTVVEKQIDSVTSSGSIFAISGASESIGVNPVDTTQLFDVSGQHGTRVFVPAWRGSGSTTLSGNGSQSIQYANFIGNSPSAYIDPYEVVFGEEENYGSTDIGLSGYSIFSATPRGEVGSGTLFTGGFFSNLNASFRPFDATDSEQLFSINGQHGTRVFVPNWIVTGSILTGAAGTASVTFNPPEFDPLFTTSGAAVDKHIDVASGSGNLFTVSGAAEKVTFRPVDATDTDFLFSISGTAGIKLRDYVWVSAVVEYDPYEYVINDEFIIPDFIKLKGTFVWDNVNNIYRSLTTESITFDRDGSGTSTIQGNVGTRTFVPNWIGSGSITITGNVTDKHIDSASGSGNLFAASGASQSVGVNPPDSVQIFNVTGSATDKHIDIASGSGSLAFTGASTDVETYAKIGSGEATFGDGSGSIQIIRYDTFGGLITFSDTATAAVTFNPPESDPLFTISGSATQSETNITSGSGSIATDVSATSRVVFNPADTEQLFEVTGAYSNFKFTSAWVGSGSIQFSNTAGEKFTSANIVSGSTTLSGAAKESQTDITSGSGTFTFDGASDNLYIKGAEQFGGTLFILEGGSERVVFKPAESNQLFEVTGTFSDIKITSDYVGTGSATLEGTLGSRIFVPNWIGSGTINVTGESTQKHIDITSGSGAFFTDGFYSNLKATFRSVSAVGLFDVTGTLVEKHIDAATGSGSVTFTGSATDSQTDIISGSGTLFSGGFFSDLKATFRPFDATDIDSLFDITGSVSQKQTSKESGSGSVALAGTLVEKHIDAVTGSGSIAAGFNASASVTFRPFDATDTDSLFSIVGSAIEKNTESYVGSGTATFSGTATESQRNIISGSGALFTGGFFSDLKATFRPFDATDLDPLFSINGSAFEKNTESYVGSGTATFSGTATESQTNITSGSGTLFSASGSAEAFVVNPSEDIALFNISGAASQRYFVRNIGSGSITTGFEGIASVIFNPPEFDPLFAVSGSYSNLKFISANVVSGTVTFSGTVVEKQIEVATGSGSATFSGTAVEKQIEVASGSGSLFTTSGASESIGVNPPDDIALFAVFGSYSNLKFISANVVSGTATFSGTVVEKHIDYAIGSGSTEFSGTAVEKQTDITSGSGSLLVGFGSSASVTFNPPEGTQLFDITGAYSNLKFISANVVSGTATFSGTVVEKQIEVATGSGSATFSGTVIEKHIDVTSGSGSILVGFGSSASVTFNPPEGTQLFDITGAYSNFQFISALVGTGSAEFSGTATEKQVEVASGSGSAEFAGTVAESHIIATSGSGILFTASGSAEAFVVNPEDTTVLYDITGAYSDLKSTNVYVGSGSLVSFSGAAFATVITDIGTGLFNITDTATESTTYKSIDGTGSLFGFAGGIESVTFNPIENTQLFEISGQSYVTTSFGYGGGVFELSGFGEAAFRRALVPVQGSGEIVSSGESTNSKIFSPYVGSGSLFSTSGSAQSTTNVPPIDPIIWEDDLRTTLYLIKGSATVSVVASIDNNVTLNISGSVIVRTALPERVFATII